MNPPAIFIVDDDASVRTAVRRLLRSVHQSTRLFSSAEQFLAHADPGARGCLILDVRLPGMSGLQLQKHLASRAWQLPLIFITAHDDAAAREAAVRGGAIDYLPKPFECERLLASVRRALADGTACGVGRTWG